MLGSAVFDLKASTAGLERGMQRGLSVVTRGLGGISTAALASDMMLVQGIGLIGVAATAATATIATFTAALLAAVQATISLTSQAALQIDALNNVEQTFGAHTGAIEKAVSGQQAA